MTEQLPPYLTQQSLTLSFSLCFNKVMTLTKSDLSQIGRIIKKEVKGEIKPLDARLKSVEKDVKKIKKNTNLIVEVFDDEYLKLQARVERIERYLKITPLTNL